MAGLLGFSADDVRLRTSFALAEEQGLAIEFHRSDEEVDHPNTVRIAMTGASGRQMEVLGVSLGGGKIEIREINGSEVALNGEEHTLITVHKDQPGIIAQAKGCQPPEQLETGKLVGGFAHEQVFALADKVVAAVKSGAIRKFVVMAGCDGRHKSRDYYTEFAKALPRDVVILTAGCAKYKYNKLDLGDIGGIPRVLDAGQCNDSYSLALIALRLKEVFGLDDINKLPLAFNIAWYEQKAVIVLLALLYLGVKNIHLGPTLPAFLSPNVAKVLVENFGIAGIGSVDDDIKLLVG